MAESYVDRQKRKASGSASRKTKRDEVAKKVSKTGLLAELNKKKKK